MKGRFSIVATPIGNLADITYRAIQTLKDCDTIACEDTRVTSKLLARYDIKKPLLIFHAQSGKLSSERILQQLGEGLHVALVTDAGTPGISDPGNELVRIVRDRLHDAVTIETIPGASALTGALAIAGVDSHQFVFLGFLPHKKGRQTLFKEIAQEERAVVFYESPHRIMKALESLAQSLPVERKVVILREITKLHESVVEGSAQEVLEHFQKNSTQVRGEFVVVVAP